MLAVEGATMLTARLKFRYEANLWSTNVTGDREQGMDVAYMVLALMHLAFVGM